MKNKLEEEIRAVLNSNSAENGSNTPDFILAEYLMQCLETYNTFVIKRGQWQGDSTVSQFAP
jgi:hypothetical protein